MHWNCRAGSPFFPLERMGMDIKSWIGRTCTFAAKPKACATIVVLREIGDGIEVLIGLRKSEPERGKWAFPGGHIKQDESPMDGAKRELFEETRISPNELFAFERRQIKGDDGDKTETAYVGSIGSNDKAKAGSDIGEVKWVPTDDLPELAFNDAELLPKAIKKFRDS